MDIVEKAGLIGLHESRTARLIDLYDEADLEDESETISHFVGPEDYEVALPVVTIAVPELLKLRTPAGDMSVIEAFDEFAEPEQEKIFKKKMKNFDPDRVIVVHGDRVIDGNHQVVAAHRLGRVVQAIDLKALESQIPDPN